MQDEVDCCVLPEYTPNNLAFHLHQVLLLLLA